MRYLASSKNSLPRPWAGNVFHKTSTIAPRPVSSYSRLVCLTKVLTRMKKLASLLSVLLITTYSALATPANAAPSDDPYSTLLSLRERARLYDEILSKRVTQLLPELMQRTQIDMWILISREYNEDPVIKTLLPANWLQRARRTTILVITREDDNKIGTYAIAPYKVGDLFERAWDKAMQPDQWQALSDFIARHDPKQIAVNQSEIWAHADGITLTEHRKLMDALPKKYQKRVVSAEPLAVGWLETRIPEEVALLKSMVAVAHAIIAEGFSEKVVTPGVTTTDDIVWWFREKVASLKLDTWFHPSVSIQRSDAKAFDHESSFTAGYGEQTVIPGDLLHVDFGITYMGLNTDTQQHAYVLKPGERQPPEYLINALSKANQLQDIFTNNFVAGRTGNEVLAMSLAQAKAQGLQPTIYTHPLGLHGHAAGTTLGMWDKQGGVPGDGDYPLHLNTAYSIELNNAIEIEAWDKSIRIMLEEDAFFDNSGVWYFNGRQRALHVIPSQSTFSHRF